MDRTKARWRFQTVDDDYGTRVSLVHADQPAPEPAPASAIIGNDWDAARVAATLAALEEAYEQLPDFEIDDHAIVLEDA